MRTGESCDYTPNRILVPHKELSWITVYTEKMIFKTFAAILCICLSLASCEETGGTSCKETACEETGGTCYEETDGR